MDGTDLFGMSPLKMKMESQEPGADIEIIDLKPASPDPERRAVIELADLHSTTRTPSVEKRFRFNHSSATRPTSSLTDHSENLSLSGNKGSKKVLSWEAGTPESASRGSPKYTSAEALRNTVSKMKL